MNFLIGSMEYDPVTISWLSATIIGAIIGFYYYNKNAFSYWEKKGLKGPEPSPIIGNFQQMLGSDRLKNHIEWPKKYGKVYGAYRAYKPDLIVADVEVLQQICIKDFDAFVNHNQNEFSNHYQKEFLFALTDDKWKRTRALMSPTFTSGKIKRMFQLLDACADDLINCFQEQFAPGTEKTLVNTKDIYNLYTMDAITTCCYGLKLERANPNDSLETVAKRNSFVSMAMKLFQFSKTRFLISAAIPKFLLRAINWKTSSLEPFDRLAHVMKQLVDKRRRSEKKLDDYLQLLVDAKLDNEIDLDEMDAKENHHAGLTKESLLSDQRKMIGDVKASNNGSISSTNKYALGDEEVVAGAMFLLVVGLETTATMLTHATYLLAFHPKIQEKLYEEVKKIVEYKESDKSKTFFTYEAITSCQYLDCVISETLRYFSPIPASDRSANKDYRIEKYNLDIPKGSVITTAFHAIMHDPDYWSEPEKFDPERFMPGNKEKIVPGSYCPFGIGPRHCLGMRFSLTEGKLALAKTIMKYRFEPRPESKFPPELEESTIGLAHINRPNVFIIQREANDQMKN